MNAVLCCHCLSVVVSAHRHDFQSCKCPKVRNITVDGGHDYKKRLYGTEASWIEIENGQELVSAIKLSEEEGKLSP